LNQRIGRKRISASDGCRAVRSPCNRVAPPDPLRTPTCYGWIRCNAMMCRCGRGTAHITWRNPIGCGWRLAESRWVKDGRSSSDRAGEQAVEVELQMWGCRHTWNRLASCRFFHVLTDWQDRNRCLVPIRGVRTIWPVTWCSHGHWRGNVISHDGHIMPARCCGRRMDCDIAPALCPGALWRRARDQGEEQNRSPAAEQDAELCTHHPLGVEGCT
jgi:hypothetical protein